MWKADCSHGVDFIIERSVETISWRKMMVGVGLGRALMRVWRYARAAVMRWVSLGMRKSMFHVMSLMGEGRLVGGAEGVVIGCHLELEKA